MGESCSQVWGRAVVGDVPMGRAQRLKSEHPTYKNPISGVKLSLSGYKSFTFPIDDPGAAFQLAF